MRLQDYVWWPGEPSDGLRDNCLALSHPTDYLGSDWACGDKHFPICQIKTQKIFLFISQFIEEYLLNQELKKQRKTVSLNSDQNNKILQRVEDLISKPLFLRKTKVNNAQHRILLINHAIESICCQRRLADKQLSQLFFNLSLLTD